jgi:hypothetical protein
VSEIRLLRDCYQAGATNRGLFSSCDYARRNLCDLDCDDVIRDLFFFFQRQGLSQKASPDPTHRDLQTAGLDSVTGFWTSIRQALRFQSTPKILESHLCQVSSLLLFPQPLTYVHL